jgi:hypothetical protein
MRRSCSILDILAMAGKSFVIHRFWLGDLVAGKSGLRKNGQSHGKIAIVQIAVSPENEP